MRVSARARSIFCIGQQSLVYVNKGLRAAFRTAAQTSDRWLFECRLSPLTHCHLALAANFRIPPFLSNAALAHGVCFRPFADLRGRRSEWQQGAIAMYAYAAPS
jgi:hypothetical protein